MIQKIYKFISELFVKEDKETIEEKQSISEQFPLANSPYKEILLKHIEQELENTESLTDDDKMAVNNMLYYIVQKRMCKREYDEKDSETYINGLLSDISEAKEEFSQVCYVNNYAQDIASSLKYRVIGFIL